MEFIIHKADLPNAPRADMFSRKFIVKSRIVLEIKNEELTYSAIDVEPYERDIPAQDTEYGFGDRPAPSSPRGLPWMRVGCLT